MTARDRYKLACIMRRAAAMWRLPAHPAAWPDWMTPEKRQQMAENFDQYAAEIEPRRASI